MLIDFFIYVLFWTQTLNTRLSLQFWWSKFNFDMGLLRAPDVCCLPWRSSTLVEVGSRAFESGDSILLLKELGIRGQVKPRILGDYFITHPVSQSHWEEGIRTHATKHILYLHALIFVSNTSEMLTLSSPWENFSTLLQKCYSCKSELESDVLCDRI